MDDTTSSRASSSGPLRYSVQEGYGYKLIVEVDPEIARYARWFIPKAWGAKTTRYAPHISVIRYETPVNLDVWGKYEGQKIQFDYQPEARYDDRYVWLRVWSPELIKIRMELGLPADKYDVTRPPDGEIVFHTTVANMKE